MNLVNTTMSNNYRIGGVDYTNSMRGFDSLSHHSPVTLADNKIYKEECTMYIAKIIGTNEVAIASTMKDAYNKIMAMNNGSKISMRFTRGIIHNESNK